MCIIPTLCKFSYFAFHFTFPRGCLYGKQAARDKKRDGKHYKSHYKSIKVIIKVLFCLYEARTFFFRQDEILLETDRISAKAEEKSPYKCFVPGWFWNSAIMWLEVANECIQKKKKKKKKTFELTNWMLNHDWHSSRVFCWVVFKKYWSRSLKQIKCHNR